MGVERTGVLAPINDSGARRPLVELFVTRCLEGFAEKEAILRRDGSGDRLRPDAVSPPFESHGAHHIHGKCPVEPS